MKVLWITNIMLPPICEELGQKVPAVGGWMFSSLKRLINDTSKQFAVATVYLGNEFVSKSVNGVDYYLLPLKGKSAICYNKHLESYWRTIKDEFKPDVVHIHGTEYPHGLAYVHACGAENVVVSLQGIISCIARYYAAGIDFRSVKQCLTFRDFIKRDSIHQGQKSFEKRGEFEIELMRNVRHIIGRTDWDKTHSLAVNPNAKYHYCGETLRDMFYSYKWSYEDCEKHSIFVSQASYPIKGIHILFEAMPMILRRYPDAKIYVAGSDPTDRPWYRITGYGKYLKKQIARLGIADHIVFTGMLDEKAMCERYLKSNVFVCCSSIENSPNSLGEAQLLEMPHIASFVGGIPEIVEYNHSILYRFEEVEMLAERICKIFVVGGDYSPSEFDRSRYDKNKNTKSLLSIYGVVNNNNKEISNVNFQR